MTLGQFKVTANWDQIRDKAPEYILLFTEDAKDTKGNTIPNRVCAYFSELNSASEVFNKLKEKKLVAFRNWIV